MNWRRGLIRLWIACSIAWVVVVILVSMAQVREVGAPIALHDGKYSIEFPNDTPKAVMKTALIEYLRKSDAALQPPTGNPWDTLNAAAASPAAPSDQGHLVPTRDLPAQIVEGYANRADRIMDGYQPRRLYVTLAWIAVTAMSVPAALLLIGATASWVARGFLNA